MINFKKYFYSALTVYTSAIVLLLLAWFLALQLTKQRVQLETGNKLLNIEQKQTPFLWDFASFEDDIVRPYQKYWHQETGKTAIKAYKGVNPQLSLNFSGDVINTHWHKKIIIQSSSDQSTRVKIQFKTDITSNVYYYSPLIKLDKKHNVIDLMRVWQGLMENNKKGIKGVWGGNKQKVSSLVLYFINPKADLVIDSISLPYEKGDFSSISHPINCSGQPLITSDSTQVNVFLLQENCWLPSNYLWLKQWVQNNYPESLLSIDSLTLWQTTSLHKINKPYSAISKLNIILYIFVVSIIIITLLLRRRYAHKDQVIEESWYKWMAKQLLFKGTSKAISPYHFVINYVVVLLPTLVLLLIMMYIKSPDVAAFKLLPMYFLWALLQQFILGYVLAQRVFYNQTQHRIIASILAALVFSLFHFPSVTLMGATFIAGCFWAYAWLLFRRLLPLAISHAVLALMFYYVISNRYLYSAKIFQWFWE